VIGRGWGWSILLPQKRIVFYTRIVIFGFYGEGIFITDEPIGIADLIPLKKGNEQEKAKNQKVVHTAHG
jgi:hypothetical protein